MGWISWGVSQIFLTSTALGALKRNGIIVLKPEAVKNESARALLVQAVSVVNRQAGSCSCAHVRSNCASC